MIVLEYLPYGDLLGYLRKSRGHEDSYNTGEKRPNSKLTEKDLLSFAWMIANGMNYLASMKVSHVTIRLHHYFHRRPCGRIFPLSNWHSLPRRQS